MMEMVFEVRKDALTWVFQTGQSEGVPLKSGTEICFLLLFCGYVVGLLSYENKLPIFLISRAMFLINDNRKLCTV